MFAITKEGDLVSGKLPGLTGRGLIACILTKDDDHDKIYKKLEIDVFTRCYPVETLLLEEILQDVLQKYRHRIQLNHEQPSRPRTCERYCCPRFQPNRPCEESINA